MFLPFAIVSVSFQILNLYDLYVVSILRNTNFAPQKYEILNHVILRAFLPKEKPRGLLTVDTQTNGPYISDHHSLATVVLDSAEEKQFRAVTWSVLYSMAEESLPSSILKLAFVEIPTKLFDSLLLMVVNSDTGTFHSFKFI